MEWVTILTTLLPVILQIINKGTAVSKPALLRRAVFYDRLAADPQEASEIRAVFFEVSEMCKCLAAAETVDEQMQIVGIAQDGLNAAAAAAFGTVEA